VTTITRIESSKQNRKEQTNNEGLAGAQDCYAPKQQITDYKMAPKGAPVNGANLGSMGFKLSTKLINKLIIIR
jgi:hypothetical protein